MQQGVLQKGGLEPHPEKSDNGFLEGGRIYHYPAIRGIPVFVHRTSQNIIM